MSDLISRSELIEEIKSLSIVLGGKQIFYDNAKYSVLRTIDEQQTAYSVDNVVEELEMEMKASSGYSAERVSAFSRAIEIVKHGGVSDDVCEWKQDNMLETVYRVCDGFYTTVYQKDFEYCPYCGKKIKIVGD